MKDNTGYLTDDVKQLISLVDIIKPFVGKEQIGSLAYPSDGSSGVDKIKPLADLISGMSKQYEQDGKGDDAVVYLHYCLGDSHWYITEKGNEETAQQNDAFGYAILNGDTQMAEIGYISIEEILAHNIKLDLEFTPCTLGEIKNKMLAKYDDIGNDISDDFDGSVPDHIKEFSKLLCETYKINGACDKMYVANVSAIMLGVGDGQGNFHEYDLEKSIGSLSESQKAFLEPGKEKDFLCNWLMSAYSRNIPESEKNDLLEKIGQLSDKIIESSQDNSSSMLGGM